MNSASQQSSQKLIETHIQSVRCAQERYAAFSQERVDEIFQAVAKAAIAARIPLAKLAVEETGMGVMEDKVVKNHYAAEYIYNAYKTEKTCGVIEEDERAGIVKIAEPIGVIAAVIPTTNPTSTTIFKALLCLKTRNGAIFSPHPRAKSCTAQTVRLLHEAAVKAGAPEGLFSVIEEPTTELSALLMERADLVLATGGTAMVKAAHKSGTPAIGVGAGNTPALLHTSANIPLAVSSIIHSKTFDNGVICSSEQACILLSDIYLAAKKEFTARGGYFLSKEEQKKVAQVLFPNGKLNAELVGKSAAVIAEKAQISLPPKTKLLLAEVTDPSPQEPFAKEKLSPVLAVYRAAQFEQGMDIAESLLKGGGIGHTASLFANESTAKGEIEAFSARMKACRVLINTPSAQGGIGDLYNFRLAPSLTLGCGSWGGNSVCDNVGVRHLLNVKTVAKRRENMLWLRTPQKIYTERGCLATALSELKTVYRSHRAFIVTDRTLYRLGYAQKIIDVLSPQAMECTVFFEVDSDPTLSSAKKGAAQMQAFQPDVVIAVGGGSAMDAAKAMWALYEHPSLSFSDMALRFADIRKRVSALPPMGKKALFVAIPTSAGTGSEVTPFAVITEEETGIKHPLADYELMPHMAIIDSDLMRSSPPSLTAAAGIDAVVHAVEAYASMLATDFTDALSKEALGLLFIYLPRAYRCGEDEEARTKTANAATMAGIAFANAFLGLCHAMAHKLGAFFHLPHGVANALLICEIIRYNAAEVPAKMGTFPKYDHPKTLQKYARLGEALGAKGKTDREKLQGFIAMLEELKTTLGIKPALKDYGVKEEEFLSRLDQMTEAAFDDQCVGANPRYPLLAEIRQIYCNIYYGKGETP